jgi:hypothetical protein
VTQLVHYETACREIALAATIDEAKDWADKAAALRAYARQAHNTELEVSVAEIRLRALRRLGELSQVLEKADGYKGNQHEVLPSEGKKLKADTLREAGVSTSAAHRCERIADVPQNTFEHVLAQQRESGKPAKVSHMLRLAGELQKTVDLKRALKKAAADLGPVSRAAEVWRPVEASLRRLHAHITHMMLPDCPAVLRSELRPIWASVSRFLHEHLETLDEDDRNHGKHGAGARAPEKISCS